MTSEPDPTDRGIDAVAALGDPVRRRIYRYVLASHDPVTRDGVAAGSGMSRSTVAYHLDKLADAGLVEVRFERLTGRSGPGAGRPAKLYLRPREPVTLSLPSREYQLLAGLLAAAVEQDDSGAAGRALRDVARGYGAAFAGAVPSGAADPRPAIHGALVEIGYEPYADDGVIRLRNCPFEALARHHRDLVCGANLALVDGIVSVLGDGAQSTALEPRPDHCCVAVHAA